MKTIVQLVVSIVLILSSVGSLTAQGEYRVPIPQKLERATQLDDDGLLQWVEFSAERCVNCKGKKTMSCQHCARVDEHRGCPECLNDKDKLSPCRLCTGSGETWDVLEHAPCPSCMGASLTVCYVCSGKGEYLVEGGGKKSQKCNICDGTGGFPCGTCKGERIVDPPKLKPSLAEAKSADLKKALKALEEVEVEVKKFASTKQARKDIKPYQKMLKPGTRIFPALKNASKHFEKISKEQSKGTIWKHFADSVEIQAKAAQDSLEYYIAHQKRVLQLCLARAEHNEKVIEEAKKK